MASFATRSLLFLPNRYPLVCARMYLRRLFLVVPLFTRDIGGYRGRKRLRRLLSMAKEEARRFCCLCDPESLALKWLCPGARATILPFLVTLSLFVNDLL